MLWFRVPPKIYFKQGATGFALRELAGKKKAFIITDNPLFGLQSLIIYSSSFQSIRTLFIKKLGGCISHQRGCAQHIKSAGSSGDDIYTCAIYFGCLHHFLIKGCVCQCANRKSDDRSPVLQCRQGKFFHGGRGGCFH